uniref:Uncharacterized protein n=1 Tax=Erythrolobus australicus TaxID=1077150 RepID=A0A7S1TMC3_9RHOD
MGSAFCCSSGARWLGIDLRQIPQLSAHPTRSRVGSVRQLRLRGWRGARGQLLQMKASKSDGDEDARSPGKLSAEEMLARDLEVMRSRRAAKAASTTDSKAGFDGGALLQKILIADFFLVLGFLAWLAVAVVSGNDDWYSQWYSLWEPFIQPALGVLMLGTIVSGLTSAMNKK